MSSGRCFFPKSTFVKTILGLGRHIISWLWDDANLDYIYRGEQSGKRGTPKKMTEWLIKNHRT